MLISSCARRWRGRVHVWVPLAVFAATVAPGVIPGREVFVQPAVAACRVPDLDEVVRCGSLGVPENPAMRSGRRITLRFVVLPRTRGGAWSAPPVFVLQGGPGQAATDLADFYARILGPLRATRDIVLLDQRGTGRPNGLACALADSTNPASYLEALFPPDRVRACARDLSQRADLRYYSTAQALADLEAVREALGYPRIDLYGTSYGTRVAEEYLRAYPSRVRAVVLKGVVPPGLVMPVPFAADAQRAFDLLARDCAADTACARAFPDVPGDLRRVLERLDSHPAAVRLAPDSIVTLSRDMLAVTLRSILHVPTPSAELPSLLHHAAAGDFAPIARAALRYRVAGEQGLANGMFLSVVCTEDAPRIRPEAVRRETQSTFLGDYWVRQVEQACARWPRGVPLSTLDQPLRSAAPVLLISGFVDGATPPRYGDAVAKGLPNAFHLVVPNAGHSFDRMSGCVDRIIDDFYTSGSARNLDTACVREVTRPPFVTGPPDSSSRGGGKGTRAAGPRVERYGVAPGPR